jgi:putative flippase GtrA
MESLKIVPAKLDSLLSRPLYRYIIIGGSIYVFELFVIFFAQYLGASSLFAVGLSFWLGLIASFLLQKVVTFKDRRAHHKVLIPQIAVFSLLVLFNFGFTLLVTKLFSPPLHPALTRTIALGLTTIWNFYLYKTRIFRASDEFIVQ